MNRLSHGCRSEKTLIPGEDPAEFDHHAQSWFDHYNPQTPDALALVREVVRQSWFFKRNSRRLEDIEFRLPHDAWHWTPTNIHLYNTFSRYKTTAERSFLRFYKETEALYHRHQRDEQARELALAKLASINMEWTSGTPEAALRDLRFEQSVEIEIVDGQTQTSYFPPNDEVIRRCSKRMKLPVYLERSLVFKNGVPPEYAWANPTPVQKEKFSKAIQKIWWDKWLEVIEREKTATGHAGPIWSLTP